MTGGRTALDSEQAVPSPFATKFTRYIDGRSVWQGHSFPRADITEMREQVSYLEDRLLDFSSAQEAMLLDLHSRVMTELGRAERHAVHTPEETAHVGGVSADAQAKARLVEEFNLNHPYFVIAGFDHPRVPVDAVREILETLDDLLTRYRHAPNLVAHMSNIRELRIDFLADPGVNAETLNRGTRSKWMTLNLSRVADRAQALEDDLYDRSTGFHPASGRSYHDDVIHEFGHAIDHATGNRLSRDIESVLRRAWAALRIAGLITESYEEWLERLPEAAFTDGTKTTLRPAEAIAVGFAVVEIDGPVIGSPQWVIHQYVTTLRRPEISPDLVVNLPSGDTKSGTATTADRSGPDDAIGSRPHDPERTESADPDLPRSAPIAHADPPGQGVDDEENPSATAAPATDAIGGRPDSEPTGARPSRTEYDGAELVRKYHPEVDEFWKKLVEVVVLDENEEGSFIGPDGEPFTTGRGQNCFLMLRSGKIVTTKDGSGEHPNLLYSYIETHADENERRIYNKIEGPSIVAGGGIWRLVGGRPEIIIFFSGLFFEHATRSPKFWAQARHRLSQNFDLSTIFIEFDNLHVGGAWQNPPENEDNSAEEFIRSSSSFRDRPALAEKVAKHLRGGNEEFWFEVENVGFPHDGGLSIDAIVHPVLGEPAAVTIDVGRGDTPETARYRHFDPGPEPERTVPAFRIVHETLTQWLSASGIAITAPIEGPTDVIGARPDRASGNRDNTAASALTPWQQRPGSSPAIGARPSNGEMPDGTEAFRRRPDGSPWSRRKPRREKHAQSTGTHRQTEPLAAPSTENPRAQRAIATLTEYFGADATERTLVQTVDPDDVTGASTAHTEKVAQWWESLGAGAPNRSGLPQVQRELDLSDEQYELLAAYSWLIGNADGIPYSVRDRANRLAIEQRIEQFLERRPGQLRRFRTTLTAAERAELRNLLHLRDQLPLIEKTAAGLTGGPRVQVVAFDPAAHGENGRVIVSIGDLDNAEIINVMANGFGSTTEMLYHRSGYAMSLNEMATLRADGAAVATIGYIGYHCPTDASVAVPRKAADGGDMLACDITAVHATRAHYAGRGSGAPMPRLFNAVGHSYGSTTTCYAGQGGRLAGVIDQVILTGSPGIGWAIRHADDFGVPVWVLGEPADPVAQLGSTALQEQRSSIDIGLGLAPTSAEFGATVLTTEVPAGPKFAMRRSDRLDRSVFKPHASYYLWHDWPSRIPARALDNIGWVAVGRGELAEVREHHAADRRGWLRARSTGRLGSRDRSEKTSGPPQSPTHPDEGAAIGSRPRPSISRPPMGAAPTEYAVATPVRPDAYQPHMAEDVRVRKLIVRDGLFCDSDGTPHNSDDYEYFLIGVQPDDFRVVGPGDFPEDEVDDDSYDFVHPHDIVFCSYADPGDGPIGAGHWRRMVNGVPQETLLTCRAFPDTLEERVKFVMQTLHWLSGHGMDLAAINLSGTFHGTIFRLSAPLHSAAELISQEYAHPESVFACATTQFWVYPAVVESTPARLSVSLPVTLLNGTSVEHTMTLTRHGDTITASFTEPTHSPGATEAAAAWTQLRSELIDPWLANSNVVVTVDISASVAATDEAAHEEQPGRTDSGAMSSADEVPDMPDAADQRTPQDRRVYHRLLAQLGDPRTARDLAARAHFRAEREQPPTDPDAAAEHLLHIADTILAEHRAAMAQLDDVVGDQPALRQQRLTNPQHGGVFFHNQPDEPQDAVGTDDVPAEPNPHRLTDREIEIEHERSETERARVDLARALGVDPRIVELRGALLQVLDQAQMELRLLSDEDWPRIQPEKLPGWLGRALDREYRAQRAMSDGATAEELARLDADTRQLEADLATILGQDQLAPGWRAADSDDKLHELRRLATRANAPREIADLVDAAARFFGLARPTPPATDSPAVAGARASIRELLTAEADIAAAEEMLDALVRTAEGPVAVRVRPEGTERVRVEVLDHSRIVPVRDEPDESTGEVMPTEAGEVTALLDKSGRWGFRIHTNGSRTRWFAAGQTQAVPVSTEPAVRMRFERGQVRQGVARARRDVGRFLSHNTRMPQTTIDAAVLALSELLGNSAQYAKQGGAEVTVEADDTRVRIGITDTSLGLPKWRIESDVDAADEVAPSPTIDLDDVDAFLAGIDLAALDSARTDPDELGNRADGEHGRGARIVRDKAFAVGTDLTRHGKTVWVEYRTPPRSYPASLDDVLDLPRGSATRADGAVMPPSPWTKRGQSAEGPFAFNTPPGSTPGAGLVGSRPRALRETLARVDESGVDPTTAAQVERAIVRRYEQQHRKSAKNGRSQNSRSSEAVAQTIQWLDGLMLFRALEVLASSGRAMPTPPPDTGPTAEDLARDPSQLPATLATALSDLANADATVAEQANLAVLNIFSEYLQSTTKSIYRDHQLSKLNSSIGLGFPENVASVLAQLSANSFIRTPKARALVADIAAKTTTQWLDKTRRRAERSESDPADLLADIYRRNHMPLSQARRRELQGRLRGIRAEFEELASRRAAVLARIPDSANIDAARWPAGFLTGLAEVEQLTVAVDAWLADGVPITPRMLKEIMTSDLAQLGGAKGEVALAEQLDGIHALGTPVHAETPDGGRLESEVDVSTDGGRTWHEAKNYTLESQRQRQSRLEAQARKQLRIAYLNRDYWVDGLPPQIKWHFTIGVDSAIQAALEAIRIEDENGRTLEDYRIEVIDDSTTAVAAGPQSAAGTKSEPRNYPASLDDVFDLAPGRVRHADGTPVVSSSWAKRGAPHEGPSAFNTPPGGVPGAGRSQSRSKPEIRPSAETAPESEADLEARIADRLSALGLETQAELLLEASLSLEEKFLGVAIIAGQPRPEVIFGKRRWAGHLGARLVARQHGNQELTVDFILELDRALTLSEDVPRGREILEPRSRVGILYSEQTSDQIAAIDDNPLLTYLPPPAGPGDYGVIKYPDFDSPADLRRELQALCDWYNAAKRESNYDPYELAARLQRWFVSIHPVEHNGQASRILMHWSLEQDGKFPSAVREFDSVQNRPSDWVAAVRAGSLRYGEFLAKLGESGSEIDPVALFGYEQQRENYRQMNGETAPFAPGQSRDRVRYTRLWKSLTSGETRPEPSAAIDSPPDAATAPLEELRAWAASYDDRQLRHLLAEKHAALTARVSTFADERASAGEMAGATRELSVYLREAVRRLMARASLAGPVPDDARGLLATARTLTDHFPDAQELHAAARTLVTVHRVLETEDAVALLVAPVGTTMEETAAGSAADRDPAARAPRDHADTDAQADAEIQRAARTAEAQPGEPVQAGTADRTTASAARRALAELISAPVHIVHAGAVRSVVNAVQRRIAEAPDAVLVAVDISELFAWMSESLDVHHRAEAVTRQSARFDALPADRQDRLDNLRRAFVTSSEALSRRLDRMFGCDPTAPLAALDADDRLHKLRRLAEVSNSARAAALVDSLTRYFENGHVENRRFDDHTDPELAAAAARYRELQAAGFTGTAAQKDVAKVAGTSQSTVSQVLRRPAADITADQRIILIAARWLDYPMPDDLVRVAARYESELHSGTGSMLPSARKTSGSAAVTNDTGRTDPGAISSAAEEPDAERPAPGAIGAKPAQSTSLYEFEQGLRIEGASLVDDPAVPLRDGDLETFFDAALRRFGPPDLIGGRPTEPAGPAPEGDATSTAAPTAEEIAARRRRDFLRWIRKDRPRSTTEPASHEGRTNATVSKRELLVVNKPFTKLLFGEKFLPGEFVNQIGTAAASSGLTYVLLGHGESTTTTAMAAAALWVPGAFELLAGYATDFWKPEKVVNSALWVGSAAATTAAGLVLADASHLGIALTAATLVEATAGTFYTSTFLNEMRNLLTESQLDSGNRLITSTGSAAGITGAALGAGLAGVAPAAPFGLNALSYWGNLANVRGFVFPPRARRKPRNLFREIGDGVRALRREKFLTQHTAFATINNAAFAMMGLRTATVLTDAGLPGWAKSAAATAPAVGGILSGFLPKALDRIDATTFYPAALASMAGFFTLMASTTDPAVIASASLVDAMVMAAAGNRVMKYAQDAFPDDLRGRAMSARRLFLKSGPALGFLGAAAVANAHGGQGGDAMAGVAAAATALTATGYSALLLVRRGRVSLRVITRGRGWLGRLSRAHRAEPAEAERASTNATRPTETSDEATRPAEDSRVYHYLMAQLGNPRIARDLAAKVHARAQREQLPTDPEAATQHLFHIADKILAEHRAAMAGLEDAMDNKPAPGRPQRLNPPQHGGRFFHNVPDEPQDGVGSNDVPAVPNPHRPTDREMEIVALRRAALTDNEIAMVTGLPLADVRALRESAARRLETGRHAEQEVSAGESAVMRTDGTVADSLGLHGDDPVVRETRSWPVEDQRWARRQIDAVQLFVAELIPAKHGGGGRVEGETTPDGRRVFHVPLGSGRLVQVELHPGRRAVISMVLRESDRGSSHHGPQFRRLFRNLTRSSGQVAGAHLLGTLVSDMESVQTEARLGPADGYVRDIHSDVPVTVEVTSGRFGPNIRAVVEASGLRAGVELSYGNAPNPTVRSDFPLRIARQVDVNWASSRVHEMLREATERWDGSQHPGEAAAAWLIEVAGSHRMAHWNHARISRPMHVTATISGAPGFRVVHLTATAAATGRTHEFTARERFALAAAVVAESAQPAAGVPIGPCDSRAGRPIPYLDHKALLGGLSQTHPSWARVIEQRADGPVRYEIHWRNGAWMFIDPRTGATRPFSDYKPANSPTWQAIFFDAAGEPLHPTAYYVRELQHRRSAMWERLGLDVPDDNSRAAWRRLARTQREVVDAEVAEIDASLAELRSDDPTTQNALAEPLLIRRVAATDRLNDLAELDSLAVRYDRAASRLVVPACEELFARELERRAGTIVTPHVARFAPKLGEPQELWVVAIEGGHMRALEDALCSNPEMASALWRGWRIRYVQLTAGESGLEETILDASDVERAYRASFRRQLEKELMAAYLEYRRQDESAENFTTWLKPLKSDLSNVPDDVMTGGSSAPVRIAIDLMLDGIPGWEDARPAGARNQQLIPIRAGWLETVVVPVEFQEATVDEPQGWRVAQPRGNDMADVMAREFARLRPSEGNGRAIFRSTARLVRLVEKTLAGTGDLPPLPWESAPIVLFSEPPPELPRAAAVARSYELPTVEEWERYQVERNTDAAVNAEVRSALESAPVRGVFTAASCGIGELTFIREHFADTPVQLPDDDTVAILDYTGFHSHELAQYAAGQWTETTLDEITARITNSDDSAHLALVSLQKPGAREDYIDGHLFTLTTHIQHGLRIHERVPAADGGVIDRYLSDEKARQRHEELLQQQLEGATFHAITYTADGMPEDRLHTEDQETSTNWHDAPSPTTRLGRAADESAFVATNFAEAHAPETTHNTAPIEGRATPWRTHLESDALGRATEAAEETELQVNPHARTPWSEPVAITVDKDRDALDAPHDQPRNTEQSPDLPGVQSPDEIGSRPTDPIGSKPTLYVAEPHRLAAELFGLDPSFAYIDDLMRIAAGEPHGPAWIDSPDYWEWQLNWLAGRGPRLSTLAAFSAAALEAETVLGLPNTSGRGLLLAQLRPRTPGEMMAIYKLETMRADEPDRPSGPDTAAHASAIGRVERELSLDELPQYAYLPTVAARPILQADRDLTRKYQSPAEFWYFDPIPRDGVFGANYPGCRALDRQSPAYHRARHAGDSLLPLIACRPVYDRFLNHWIEPYQLRHAEQLRDEFHGTRSSPENRIAQWFTSVVANVLAAPPDAAPEILHRALHSQLRRRTGRSVPTDDAHWRFVSAVHELLSGDYDFGHYLQSRDHPETEGYVRTVRETVLRRHSPTAVARVPFIANVIGAFPADANPNPPAPDSPRAEPLKVGEYVRGETKLTNATDSLADPTAVDGPRNRTPLLHGLPGDERQPSMDFGVPLLPPPAQRRGRGARPPSLDGVLDVRSEIEFVDPGVDRGNRRGRRGDVLSVWHRFGSDDSTPDPTELSPALGRALRAAEADAEDVVTYALQPAQALGLDATKLRQRDPEAIARTVRALRIRQRRRFESVLRRLVADDALTELLDHQDAISELDERVRSLPRHLEAAKTYLDEVRTALAIMAVPELFAAAGVSPFIDDDGQIVEAIGYTSDGRVIVASPLRDQRALLDLQAPGFRRQAPKNGVSIEYWHVRIDDQGRLVVETISGAHPDPERTAYYYRDRDYVWWRKDLADERPFAEKYAEALASGEIAREHLKGDTGDATMSAGVSIVHYRNGFRHIEKKVRDIDQRDAEKLAAITLADAGSRPAEVLGADEILPGGSELVLLIEYVPGFDASDIFGDFEDAWRDFFHTPTGQRLGRGDTLVRPWDRHERGSKNWRLQLGFIVRPIDNGNAYQDALPPGGFTLHYATVVNEKIEWRKHYTPRAELEAVRERTLTSKAAYDRRNRAEWYQDVIDNLARIEASAWYNTPADNAEAVLTLTNLRDVLAERLNLPGARNLPHPYDELTPSDWRTVIASKYESLRRFREMGFPADRTARDLDTLDKLTKLLLHAQMRQVTPDALDDSWVVDPDSDTVGQTLTEVYLDGLAVRLADVEAAAQSVGHDAESHIAWVEEFGPESGSQA
ncbi:MFS transporter [Nocardia sp. AB354]|uniref:MFS transporter n=1 Tax=Nocardia sp. AB354 TaxID=3413283 RepID=UPI003C270C82